MKEVLSQNNVRFAYMDISSSMIALKKFLKIRDTSPTHDEVRAKHSVGIPCLVIDDNVYITETTESIEKLLNEGAFE